MQPLLLTVTRGATLTFLLASMLEFGLGLRLREILAALGSVRQVIVALAVNFVIVPLLAIAIVRAMRLEQPFAAGLILLGLAPGAPFLPKVVQLARGDLGAAVGLLVLFLAGSVIYLPLMLPLAVDGAAAGPWEIGRSMLFLMLLPLGTGMLLNARVPSLPSWLRPSVRRLANLAGVAALALIVTQNVGSLAGLLGTGAILAGGAFVALSGLAGWLAGGGPRGDGVLLGLGTALRNFAVSLTLAAQDFEDPGVAVMVVATALVSLSMLLPAAHLLGRRRGADGREH